MYIVFVLLILGVETIICSEFCYKNTYSDAASAGCIRTGTLIGPGGFACYSAHHTGPGSCSYTTKSNPIIIGAQGGVSSGFSSFTVASDVCYSYVTCVPSAPYLWGDTLAWDCVAGSTSPLYHNGSWSAQHASGSTCP